MSFCVHVCCIHFCSATDYGPKFYNVRPSSLVGEEGGEDMVETGIDEEVSQMSHKLCILPALRCVYILAAMFV